MSIMTASMSIGYIYGIIIGIATLDSFNSGNWRGLVIWSSLPGLISLILSFFFLDESARFDLCACKFEQAFLIINKMIRYNKSEEFPNFELQEEKKERLIKWSN